MNLLKNVCFAISLAIMLAGCSNHAGDNPTTVTKNFMTALSNKEFEKASTYATRESKTIIDLIKSLDEMGKNSGAEAQLNETDAEKMKNAVYSDAVIDGDKATVKVTVGNDVTEVKLKKEDGLWKVALDKNTFSETADEKATEMNQSLDEAIKELEGISVDSIKNAINQAGDVLKNDSVRKALEAAGEALQKTGEAMKEVSRDNQ